MARPTRKRETHDHKDGSVRAKGWLRDGAQIGEWTTCDAKGDVYKVTRFK